ncbi:hypothetical protein SSX86_014277 [Deinandra increscens subsp. villosa]|uniref:Uncharacterized protein n=1 Tax=Deinandra increscens subsp. villosa TaxID=3103831 RepID=A0AAP0D978_9ASTR
MATATDIATTNRHRRSPHLVIGCMSPSVHEGYTLINSGDRRRRRWKKLMKKMVEESKKSIYGSSKPVVFGYDAVSYSQNFDEGNRGDEYRFSQAFR